jgi:hypothetical protein
MAWNRTATERQSSEAVMQDLVRDPLQYDDHWHAYMRYRLWVIWGGLALLKKMG